MVATGLECSDLENVFKYTDLKNSKQLKAPIIKVSTLRKIKLSQSSRSYSGVSLPVYVHIQKNSSWHGNSSAGRKKQISQSHISFIGKLCL
jgi:hypothetical protein